MAIAGFRNVQQAVDHAQAAEVELTPEDLQMINAIGRTVSDRINYTRVIWNF